MIDDAGVVVREPGRRQRDGGIRRDRLVALEVQDGEGGHRRGGFRGHVHQHVSGDRLWPGAEGQRDLPAHRPCRPAPDLPRPPWRSPPGAVPGVRPYSTRANAASNSGRRSDVQAAAVVTRWPLSRTSGSGSVYGRDLRFVVVAWRRLHEVRSVGGGGQGRKGRNGRWCACGQVYSAALPVQAPSGWL